MKDVARHVRALVAVCVLLLGCTAHVNPSESSSTILYDEARQRVWCVNPDNASVTCLDVAHFTKLFEVPVPPSPQTLALGPDGTVWVACREGDCVQLLDADTGADRGQLTFAYGSAPYGILCDSSRSRAYVSLQGAGAVAQIHTGTRAVLGKVSVPSARGLGLTADGQRLLVTRFISPVDSGQIADIDLGTWQLTRWMTLVKDLGPDTEGSGRGVPNYINAVRCSPTGDRAWVLASKANTDRGLSLDGLELDPDSTVRVMAAQIDLATNTEVVADRIDINDRDLALDIAFSQDGRLAFIVSQGNRRVDVIQAADGLMLGQIKNVGFAPDGLCFDQSGRILYIHSFLSRKVMVFDVGNWIDETGDSSSLVASLPTVAQEALSATVLKGKQIFYNADDRRMNSDGYISCASCHLDGGHDGRTWDFTDRGEGHRNTITLRGRRGMGHGRVHWTANFDEIQDFEHDIRGGFGGHGFMDDVDFNSDTRNTTLGTPKTGVSSDLDALAAYVASLDSYPKSPHRDADGHMTSDAIAGEQIFISLNCVSCHQGADFTDSISHKRHDVGTISARSGQRLGAVLDGLDTPTLKGIWNTAPYFHDGSADTIMAVIEASGPRHGDMASLTMVEKQQLEAYLLQIDGSSHNPSNTKPTISDTVADPEVVTGKSTVLSVVAGDVDNDTLSYTWSVTAKPVGADDPIFSVNGGAFASTTVTFGEVGAYTFGVTVTDGRGGAVSDLITVMVSQTASGLEIE